MLSANAAANSAALESKLEELSGAVACAEEGRQALEERLSEMQAAHEAEMAKLQQRVLEEHEAEVQAVRDEAAAQRAAAEAAWEEQRSALEVRLAEESRALLSFLQVGHAGKMDIGISLLIMQLGSNEMWVGIGYLSPLFFWYPFR